MDSHDDLMEHLRIELIDRLGTANTELEALLATWLELQGLEEMRLSEALHQRVACRRQEVGDAILALLRRWKRVGAEVHLALGPIEPRTRALAERTPEPAPEPAPDPSTHDAAPAPIAQRDEVEEAPTSEVAEAHADAVVDAADPGRPEEPDVVEAAPAPLPTKRSLHDLKARFSLGKQLAMPAADDRWLARFTEILRGLGPPREDDGELDRVLRAATTHPEWAAFPKQHQRILLAMIVARMRHLQDAGGASAHLDACFSALTAWSAAERPGFVFGLSREHRPQNDTWMEDAETYWEELGSYLPEDALAPPNRERLLARIETLVGEIDRAPAEARDAVRSQVLREVRAALDAGVSGRDPGLVRICAPLADALQGPSYRALRRAIRDHLSKDPEDPEGSDPIPTDWGWWHLTRDRHAVMVGGSPREPNRQRLERAFGFASLAWEPSEHKRNHLQTLRDRIASGSVDMLILLNRFIGHDADHILIPACRDAGVPAIRVDAGYGVDGIRRAIEYFTESEANRASARAI